MNFKNYLKTIIRPYFFGVIKFIDDHFGINLAKYIFLLTMLIFWLWEGLKHLVTSYWWQSGVVILVVIVLVSLYDYIKEQQKD